MGMDKGVNWLRLGKYISARQREAMDSAKTLKNLNANIDVEHAVALAA